MELHRQLQRELEGAKPEGRDEQKEVSDNTTKFLALVPPSSHNEGLWLCKCLNAIVSYEYCIVGVFLGTKEVKLLCR